MVSILKPYYQHAGITIYHGDCREILPQISGVDSVISDPPYGIDFDTDYRRFTTGFDVERKAHSAIHGDSEPFDPTPWLTFRRVVLWGTTPEDQIHLIFPPPDSQEHVARKDKPDEL
jgi:hypothetical protein